MFIQHCTTLSLSALSNNHSTTFLIYECTNSNPNALLTSFTFPQLHPNSVGSSLYLPRSSGFASRSEVSPSGGGMSLFKSLLLVSHTTTPSMCSSSGRSNNREVYIHPTIIAASPSPRAMILFIIFMHMDSPRHPCRKELKHIASVCSTEISA